MVDEDVLVVAGVPVRRVSWFRVDTQSLLLASATADAARLHVQACVGATPATVARAPAELDFMLFDGRANSSADKLDASDYSFLDAQPQPPRAPGEALAAYQARLRAWMVTCYASFNAAHFPDLLRTASPALFSEYEAVLQLVDSAAAAAAAGGGDGGARPHALRVVRGLVAPSMESSGGHVIVLTTPLFLSPVSEKIFQSLNNVAVLYCKVAHLTWHPSYQLTSVEVDVHTRFRTGHRTGKLTLAAESIDIQLRDAGADAVGESGSTAASLRPFLQSCIDLYGLPRVSTTQHGVNLRHHLPQLEQALYRRIREPLHFMKLLLGLTADLGSPLHVSAVCRGVASATSSSASPPPPPPLHRTATFGVVDRSTSLGFTVGLHYHSGEELPSVETTCNQFLNTQHAVTVSRRVKFAGTAASMRKDDDGFLDVEELRVAIVRGTLTCIASSTPLT